MHKLWWTVPIQYLTSFWFKYAYRFVKYLLDSQQNNDTLNWFCHFLRKNFIALKKFLGTDLKKGFIMISERIHNNLLVLFTYYIIIMVLEIFKIAKQVFPLYLLRWWTINFHNENQR